MKRIVYVLMLLVFLFPLGACSVKQTDSDDTDSANNPTVQSNFYQTINKDWLNGGWISSGSPFYNEFTRIQIEVDEQLRSDFEKMASGVIEPQTEDQIEFIKLYKKGLDFAARGTDGVTTARTILDEMTVVDSFATLAPISQEWLLKDYQLPYGVEVIADPKNTSQTMLMLTAPQTILPDKTYYEDADKKDYFLEFYRTSASHILVEYGYTKEEAAQLVDGAIAFDARIAPFLPSSEDLHSAWGPVDESKLRSFSKVKGYSAVLSLGDQLSGLIGTQPQTVYVSNPAYFEELGTLVQEENFSDYKAWALVSQMMKLAPYMTGEIMQTADRFTAELRGQSAALPNDYLTYLDVTDIFKETLSIYYGQNYADAAAITAAQDMTQAIVSTYKERILANNWLSDTTKQAAVKKLDNLSYHIGYPSDVSERTKLIKIDDSHSYAENMLAIKRKARELSFAHYSEPIDRRSWNSAISSSDVTATYSPYQNAIYIPAAILQAPYYDSSQSLAVNYGGLGKIIAHEITHALDSTGANFDETGSLKNWWTDKDRKQFNKKTKAMVELFDGLEIYGGKVDGQLTLSENIADLGGLLVALETLKKEEEAANLEEFFEHYAMSRRESVSADYGKYMLTTETHAPEEFRVNIQLQQIDDFYQTYDIQKGDPMYRAPEERVVIW